MLYIKKNGVIKKISGIASNAVAKLINFLPPAGMNSTNVQDAINEVNSNKDNKIMPCYYIDTDFNVLSNRISAITNYYESLTLSNNEKHEVIFQYANNNQVKYKFWKVTYTLSNTEHIKIGVEEICAKLGAYRMYYKDDNEAFIETFYNLGEDS